MLTLPKDLDVVGDVHGCLEPLQELLARWGYKDLKHPERRTLLFLGDLIDRGPHSLEVLDLVMEALDKGHHALLGNHEANLLKGLQGEIPKSENTRITLHHVLHRGLEYVEKLKFFLSTLPAFAISDDRSTGYCHADVTFFNPFDQPLRSFIHGTCRVNETRDTDAEFALNRPQSFVKNLVRGHIAATSSQDCVTSLDRGIAFGGPLCGLRDQTLWEQQCDFDVRKQKPSLQKTLERLVKDKLISTSIQGPLTLYKYNKKAFFSPAEVWKKNPILREARGLVLDLAGQPANRPFSRLLNYGEEGTQLDPDEVFVASEKINGFLGQCFLHPYEKGTVVTTTSGSLDLDNEHNKMFRAFLFQKGLYGRVRKWLLH